MKRPSLARTLTISTAGLAAAATLAACGSSSSSASGSASPSASAASTSSAPAAPATTSPATVAAGAAITACMVLDTGGVDDHSFNESSYAGMTAAAAANPNIKVSYVPSNSSNDYTPNIAAEVAKGCDPIITVGGLQADNTKAEAAANPTKHFAEVDADPGGANAYGIEFNTAQGAFLGGYLAAGMTKTGKVATWGGLNIPPVTVYMDGFYEGVQYYNSKNGKSVQVLGWNEADQKGGTFSQSFTDQNKGKQISQTFVQQGADIIFPVAGGAGLGAGAAAQASNGNVSVEWVDTDGCVSVPQYCKFFLTSVTKNLTSAVQTYVTGAATGTFPTGVYVGTLANNGTGLAPYHDFASKVPAALTSQLATIKAAIIAGTIKITSPSQPTS